MPLQRARLHIAAVAALTVASSACMSLTPQLHPTDIEALEQLEDRDEREQAYIDNAIVRVGDVRGVRYTKGQRVGARPRSWQSLDLILRSDRNSAAALPQKKIRVSRVLAGFMIASTIVTLGGIASSAREGLDLSRPTGTSAALIGGAVGMLAFGIATGVVWGQARAGYEGAVDVYNDSLALRLGISDANGEYRPPEGVLVDEEGFIILDQKEMSVPQLRPKPPPAVVPEPEPEPEPEPSPDASPDSSADPGSADPSAVAPADPSTDASEPQTDIETPPSAAPPVPDDSSSHTAGLVGPARARSRPSSS